MCSGNSGVKKEEKTHLTLTASWAPDEPDQRMQNTLEFAVLVRVNVYKIINKCFFGFVADNTKC